MAEYGAVVSQNSGAVTSGAGSRSFDLGREAMGVVSDLVDRIASLPPEVLVVMAAIVLVGGFMMTRRTV